MSTARLVFHHSWSSRHEGPHTHNDPSDEGEEDHANWDGLPDEPIDEDDTLVFGCLFPDTCLAGYHHHDTCACYTAEMADAYDEAMENKERETVSDPRAA